MTIQLVPIPSTHIDRAWDKDGARVLARACDASGGEITADQLKMILSRGERVLIGMKRGDAFVGWGVVRVDQLPNFRVLHVCEMTAPHADFPTFYQELRGVAELWGCSRIRCSAKPAQARLFRSKLGMKPVYETLEEVL